MTAALKKSPAGVLEIRRAGTPDAAACGRAAFEAHRCVAEISNFPAEHPSLEFSVGLMSAKLADPRARGWVALARGEVIGSVFLNDLGAAAAVGPLTVHPSHEGGAGRALMQAALRDAGSRGVKRLRLVQSPSHLRSLALYASLGFEAREPLVLLRGKPASLAGDGVVRPLVAADAAACDALCERVHGFARAGEVAQAAGQPTACVLERAGRVRAYASAIGFRGHSVAESVEELAFLVSHAPQPPGPGFFVPIRQSGLLRTLLAGGMRALWPAMLMTRGDYQEPKGAFLPSIAF